MRGRRAPMTHKMGEAVMLCLMFDKVEEVSYLWVDFSYTIRAGAYARTYAPFYFLPSKLFLGSIEILIRKV